MTGFAAAARRHPGLTFVALPCVVIVLAVLALWPAPHTPQQGLAAGVALVAQDRPAPAFSRPLLSGPGTLSLRQLRGNLVVVNFWASWCAACRGELPRLRDLAHRERGVVFVGVDEQDTRSSGQAFVRRFRPGYRNVFDPSGGLLREYGSIGLPTTFIIDRTGRIRYQGFGALDAANLRTALARMPA